MQPDPLNSLHDIVLPAKVSAWPLATGWWILLALSLLGLGLSIFFSVYYWRKRQKRRIYLHALMALTPADNSAYYTALNRLLKQTALAYAGPAGNTLTGEAWLNYLDKLAGQRLFMPQHASFAHVIDNPAIQCDAHALQHTCEKWLRALK